MRLRILFYLTLSVLGLILGFGLMYFVVSSATRSHEFNQGLWIAISAIAGPLIFVVLYWSCRFEFRAHKITPEDSKTIARASWIVALSGLPFIIGYFAWSGGFLVIAAVGFLLYSILTICYLRMLWGSYQSQYRRALAEGLFLQEPQKLTQSENRILYVVIAIGIVEIIFVCTGVYLILTGSFWLGLLASSIAAVLSRPMVQKLRKISVSPV